MTNTKAAVHEKNGNNAKGTKRREGNGATPANGRKGEASADKAMKVRLPVVGVGAGKAAPSVMRPRNRAPGGDLQMRFKFASVVRLADNLVRKAVTTYDRTFLLPDDDQADIYLDLGRRLLHDGKVSEALEAFRKASTVRPDDPAPLFELGMLQARRGALEAAMQALEKARALGQSSYKLHMTLAEVFTRQEKHDQAIEELENALRLRKDIPEIPYRLGVSLSRAGRCEEAIDAFELAIDLAPHDVSYHQSLGFALESATRRSEAVECFKRALELEHAAGMEAE
jgi:tetratricopeptide (TPR) repeat protein